MTTESSDDLDRTDELPVLLETVVLGEHEALVAVVPDETAAQTSLYAAPASEAFDAEPMPADDGRAARIEELERLNGELVQQLNGKEAVILELERSVAELRSDADSRGAMEQELTRQLAERDMRIAELGAERDGLRTELDARAAEVAALELTAGTAERSRAELEARAAALTAASDSPELERLREDHAALVAYIATRREAWERTDALRGALAARVESLEKELVTNELQARRAEELGARESARATQLRAELVATARQLESAERQLKELRAAPVLQPVPAPVEPVPSTAPPRPATAEPAQPPPAAAEPAQPPPAAAEPPPDEAAIEVIGQLEAEVSHKRQQVAAQMVELREREQRLATLTADLEDVRRENSARRAESDELRAKAAALERVIADKDRALDARDARIAALENDQKQHVAAMPTQAAFAGRKLDRPAERRPDVASDAARVPALLCLTGEVSRHFALTKKSTVIGRGAQCDLQILTHFVSREHARVSVAGSAVLIEDLGSRNGVFVNSVRVDRQPLEHGDLITIGETQFRFIESMAH